jgi:hypothetical protein
MPFEKGHNLSKGRPKGAKNKATDIEKAELHDILFNVEDMAREFKNLDAYKKWEIRCRFQSSFYSKPTTEIELNRDLPLFID